MKIAFLCLEMMIFVLLIQDIAVHVTRMEIVVVMRMDLDLFVILKIFSVDHVVIPKSAFNMEVIAFLDVAKIVIL